VGDWCGEELLKAFAEFLRCPLVAESGLGLYFAALAAKQAREATAASAGILAFSSTIDRKLRILRGRVLECSMAFRTGSRT